MHRFRDNVFLLIGNDVTVIPPLEGGVQRFSRTDSERVTRSLYSCSIDIFCLSSTAQELFDLFVLVGISLLPAKFVGFSGKMTPKKLIFRKTLARVRFHTSNCVFEGIVSGSRFMGLGCTRG